MTSPCSYWRCFRPSLSRADRPSRSRAPRRRNEVGRRGAAKTGGPRQPLAMPCPITVAVIGKDLPRRLGLYSPIHPRSAGFADLNRTVEVLLRWLSKPDPSAQTFP